MPWKFFFNHLSLETESGTWKTNIFIQCIHRLAKQITGLCECPDDWVVFSVWAQSGSGRGRPCGPGETKRLAGNALCHLFHSSSGWPDSLLYYQLPDRPSF